MTSTSIQVLVLVASNQKGYPVNDKDAGNSGPEPSIVVRRSGRDRGEVRARLESWLHNRLPAGTGVTITSFEDTSATGMSSETILFDADWIGETHHLVARIAPRQDDVPVFPNYDMQKQFDVIAAVSAHSEVPVPDVLWCENDPAVLGTPFFLMRRVDGVVPPDNLPYNFGGNWLCDASTEQQRKLQDTSVGVLAGLHAIDDAPHTLSFLEFPQPGETHLRRHVANARAWYEFSMADDGIPSPTVERGFEWLVTHWPADEGDTVLSWGDSRIGNMMFQNFEPVAVLDWEMVGLGPREIDLGWMIYSHAIYEDYARRANRPGMPHFMQPADVASTYESLTGHAPAHLDFYIMYAAIQWAIVGLRTGRRQVHFGERDMPADIDKFLLNRGSLNRMLDGTSQFMKEMS